MTEFNQPTESEIIDSFRSFAAENGIDLPDNVIADGKIHRFRLADEPKGKLSGAYKLYTNGRPAGFLQDFKSGFKENWKFTSENYRAPVLTPEQREIQKQAFERQQQQFLLEQQQSYDNAAAQAREEWNKTQTAIDHPYLSHKGVKIHNARINEYKGVPQLIIPLQNKEGKLTSLQRIKINGVKEDGSPNFFKMNMKDGKKSDAFSILNRQENPKIIAIAEGFATTASVIEDDFAVKNRIMGVMAVDADNLKSVAQSMRELHPTATILVFADMGDHLNKGEHRAKAAAEAVGGFAVLPPIAKGDMNDYLTGNAGEITATLEQLVNSATNDLLAKTPQQLTPAQEEIAKFMLPKQLAFAHEAYVANRDDFQEKFDGYNNLADMLNEPHLTIEHLKSLPFDFEKDLDGRNRNYLDADYDALPLANQTGIDNSDNRVIFLAKTNKQPQKIVTITNDYVLAIESNSRFKKEYLDLPVLTREQALEVAKSRVNKTTGEKINTFFEVLPRAYAEHYGYRKVPDRENLLSQSTNVPENNTPKNQPIGYNKDGQIEFAFNEWKAFARKPDISSFYHPDSHLLASKILHVKTRFSRSIRETYPELPEKTDLWRISAVATNKDGSGVYMLYEYANGNSLSGNRVDFTFVKPDGHLIDGIELIAPSVYKESLKMFDSLKDSLFFNAAEAPQKNEDDINAVIEQLANSGWKSGRHNPEGEILVKGNVFFSRWQLLNNDVINIKNKNSLIIEESMPRNLENLAEKINEVSSRINKDFEIKEEHQSYLDIQPETLQKTTSKEEAIKNLAAKLSTPEGITKAYLTEQANLAFDGSMAGGNHSFKEAYDLMEAAVNIHLLHAEKPPSEFNAKTASEKVIELTQLVEKLPTQTVRDPEMDRMQQFSTPPALSFVANWVAQVNNADIMLEPSAGTGDLAIWAKRAGATVVLNELSDRRAETLKAVFPDAQIFKENAEQLNNVLPDAVKPTVIVMNPPFSTSVGVQSKNSTSNGAKHIEQALLRLAENGRLVAIVGQGMAADKASFKEWWRDIQSQYNVRANISISGKEYAKYGTTFDNQIIVIDKNGATTKPVLTGKVESVSELPTLLEAIKNERPNITSHSESARVEPTSDSSVKTSQAELQPSLDLGNNRLDDMGSDGKSEHGNRNARIGSGQSGLNESTQQSEQNARTSYETSNANGQRGRDESGIGQESNGRSDGVIGNASNESDSRINRGGVSPESEITDAVFSNYSPQKLAINGAKPHPSKLVQSAAMASVEPPLPTYSPQLPPAVINDGLLSLAQLEAVVYAGQAHNEILPNGSRKGFFIGDGTGVGKGREISGVILDNLMQGRKKAVWVSFSKDLMKDAQRDLAGVGGDASLIQWHGKTKINDSIKSDSGIVFTSYSTLSAESKQQATDKGQAKGNSRLDQLVDWLGKDFDGVIAFDEAHSMGNAIAIKGKRGTTKPSKRAITGINLQKALPNARIVYVSATGATEINNLAYADRLGLWGEGTAFSDVTSFVNEVSSGGVAAMELVSRDMKSLGNYISRSLSFDGVTYQRMEHDLTPLQTEVYNELATAWQTVLQNINTALDKTEANGNSNAKGAALSAFWGAHQRFFNQVITSMQTPMVIDDIQKQLDSGNVAVVQIINTNEATQERELAKAAEDGVVLEELDFTPRQQLISYIENSFPVQQYHQVEDADGNKSFEPTLDSSGNPVFNKEVIKMRDELIKTLETIRVPDNPIDSIINHFGSDTVAEVTGRSRRFVHGKDEQGEFKVIEEKRGQGSSQADAKAFQDDKKKVLLFSSAGGTGFSFHADNTAINQRKRYHYILQAGWRADSAVQGFGRTHRTNQKQPPHYVLPTTNLKAQKRFISSVARRLDQLGALTRGQRQTTSQGLLTASDNLESPYARLAIYTLFQDMYRERTVGLNFHEVTREMGLNLIDKQTGAIKDDKIPTTTQFLNRLLSLTTHRQDQVFEAFEERLVDAVDHAKQQGIFDEGVQVFRAKNIEKTSDTVVFTEPKSGAQTRIVGLEVTNDKKYADWNAILAIQQSSIAKNEEGGFFVGLTGKFENKVFYLKDRHSLLNAEGKEVHRGTLYGISGQPTYIDNTNEVLQGFKYGMVEGRYQQIPISQKITAAEAKERWVKELDVAPKTETEKMNILVGAILPIWDRINGKDYTIYRTQTDSGEQLLGRLLSEQHTKETLKNLGVASNTAKMSNADLFANVQAGNKAILANGWAITTATVNNETRLEIRSQSKGSSFFTPANQKLLEEQGAFVERIQWQDRLFIPNNAAGFDVFTRITASKPVVDLIGDLIKLETAKSIEQTAPVNATEPKAKYPQTIEYTQVNSIRLNWSEKSDVKNKVFPSFSELQEFMRSEFKTESDIPLEFYVKQSLSIEMSTPDHEHSITLTPRVDVSKVHGDFDPFTMNLSKYLSDEYIHEHETMEGGKFTAQIPIEPDLPVALPETEAKQPKEDVATPELLEQGTEQAINNPILEETKILTMEERIQRSNYLVARNKEIFFSELVEKYGWERDVNTNNGIYKLNPINSSGNYIHIATDLDKPFMGNENALAFSGKNNIGSFVSFVMSEIDISGNTHIQPEHIQDSYAKKAAIEINSSVDKWILENPIQLPTISFVEAEKIMTSESETQDHYSKEAAINSGVDNNSVPPEEILPMVNVTEPVKAWMMTSEEFSAIATAEPLINHGRKWEVFAGGQSFGFTDSETATEAIKEAHERSVNNALYSRTTENNNGIFPVNEMPPAEVLAEYPQTVARFPELFPETVNQSESISKSIAPEGEIPEGEKITVSTEAPLRVTKKLANALTSILDATGVDSSHEFITVHFSDPDYSPRTGGYHPVEISIGKEGKINYITDYTYFGREPYVELVKDLDFDFENGRFQQLGMGDSREYYIKEGAGLFRTWQANFSHYHESGVFDVEVRTDKGIFKMQLEPEIVPISPLIEEPAIDYSSMPDYGDIPLPIPDSSDYFMPDIDYSTIPAEPAPQPAFESATPEPQAEPVPINSIENATQIQVTPQQAEIEIEPEMLAQKQNDVKTKIEVVEQPETPKKESAIKELIKEWQSRLPESEQKENPAPLQTTLPLSDDDRRIPPDVGAKYLQVENKFFHRKNPEIPVFEDKGAKIETKYNSQAVAADLVKIAKERGWDTIKINGTNEFRRETWFEAQSRGIKTIGYTPTEFDKQLLAERLANAKTNSIEPATFADLKKPDTEVKLQKPDVEKVQTTPQSPKTPKKQQMEIEL